MEKDDRPSNRSSIHTHPVYCDDYDVREYLRHLDSDEARVIFDYAKNHGSAEFEFKKGGTTHDCTMKYDDGAYIVQEQENAGGGWF
ncbi:MAG: hypothetical protein HY566_00620 [Candidatus Kerfeldbacteria bacterium]|nr:hypothetical protein [Candidatus Kerfeldbacteria bacterium]